MVFFGAAVVLFSWQLMDARPRLIVDDHGVFDRTLGVGVIPWSEITEAYVRSIKNVDFICLGLRDPRPAAASPIKRAVAAANKVTGFTALNINRNGTMADAR